MMNNGIISFFLMFVAILDAIEFYVGQKNFRSQQKAIIQKITFSRKTRCLSEIDLNENNKCASSVDRCGM